MLYEHVTVSTFLDLFGLQNAGAMRRHFEAVTIDQQEGLLASTDSVGAQIAEQPQITIRRFVNENTSKFVLEYPAAARH